MLLCTGFLSYSGPFNQEFRDMLMGKWQKDMKSRKIPFTANLNVTGMLVDAATVSMNCLGSFLVLRMVRSPNNVTQKIEKTLNVHTKLTNNSFRNTKQHPWFP